MIHDVAMIICNDLSFHDHMTFNFLQGLHTPPLSGGGGYQLTSFWGKNMKRGRGKGGKCKKGKKGEEKEKMRSKTVF
jgi:hypothetical protein